MKANLPKPKRREGGSPRPVPEAPSSRAFGFYSLSDDGKSITCQVCGFTSLDARHVAEKFCPRCLVFHEDRLLMRRLNEGFRAEFHSRSEEVSRLRAAA